MRAVPMRLHRGDLDRLVLQRVEPVLVADEELQRREHERPCRAPMRSMVRPSLAMRAGEQVARADRQHDEGGRQIGRGHHVGEAIAGSSD